MGDFPRLGACAVVVRPGLLRQDDRVLVGRRLSDLDDGRDSWSFPGGKVEPGERIVDAAVRELAEETGIICEPGSVMLENIGWVERFYEREQERWVTFYTRLILHGAAVTPVVLEPDACAEWRWVNPFDLHKMKLFGPVGDFLEDRGVEGLIGRRT